MKRTPAALVALLAVTTFVGSRAQAQQRRAPAAPPAPPLSAGSVRTWTGAANDFALPVIGPEYQMLGRIFQDTEHFKSSYAQDQILPALAARYPPIYGYRLDMLASADLHRRKFSYGAPLGCDWMAKAMLAVGSEQGVTVETKTTPDVCMVTRAAADLKGQDFVLLRCWLAGYIPNSRPDLSSSPPLKTEPADIPDNLSGSRWVFKIGVQPDKTNFSAIVSATDTITVSDQTGREWKQPIGELWAWLMQTPEFHGKTYFLHQDNGPIINRELAFRFEYLIVHIPEKTPVKE